MIPELSGEVRVITLDLPGFGKSEQVVPDYSVAAHAAYLVELLDRLEIERAHLLGFSMGGGVVLEAAEELGERATSITLLAAIGVQELELLGDYHLNHAVHALQLAALTLVREGLPHFGAYDRAFFGVPYARNFFDTDQRPLRGILERLEQPLLVVHAESDSSTKNILWGCLKRAIFSFRKDMTCSSVIDGSCSLTITAVTPSPKSG